MASKGSSDREGGKRAATPEAADEPRTPAEDDGEAEAPAAAAAEGARAAHRPRRRKDAIRRGRVKQAIRRTGLAISLASIVVLPLAQLALSDAESGGAARVGASGPGFRIAAEAPWLAAVGEVLSGSVWSITIAGFEIADPLAATLVAAAGQTGVLLSAALLPIVATALLGRVFCGWVCPARLPVELAAWIRRRGKRSVLKLPKLRWAKYGVLAAGLGLAGLLGWNLVALIYPPAILVREAQFVLAYGAMGWGAVVVGAAFVADLAVDRGAWCRGLCPGGALYSLLAQPALLRLRLDTERCTRCNRCGKVCPLGLDPTTEPGGECDRCGLCQRECRDDALAYRLSPPFSKTRPS